MADASLPREMPGHGGCPPGERPVTYPGMPPGSRACAPIGPGVPAGGWKPAAPGGGPGYPPAFSEFGEALDDATFPGSTGALGNLERNYADWIRRLARR